MTGSKSSNSRKVQTVCKFYKKNICWHGKKGTNCKFEHPQMCVKYMKHGNTTSGCTKGLSCKYLHPILCKYAVKYGACYKMDCTFTHIKGTLRCKSNLRCEAQSNAFIADNMAFPMDYTHSEDIRPRNVDNMHLRNNANNMNVINPYYVPNYYHTTRVNRRNYTPQHYLGPDT